MKKFLLSLCLITAVLFLAACFGGTSRSNSSGGEVTGVGGSSITEPTPYGMVLVNKGSLKMGSENTDSLWGKQLPTREISVDAFWMDEHEVTNSMYRQFVFWVRDSIIRERLAAGSAAAAPPRTHRLSEKRYHVRICVSSFRHREGRSAEGR